MTTEVLVERKEAPPEYTEFLRRIGGANPFGEPNFILFWGQTFVPRSVGKNMLLGHNRPCWNLAMWRPAEEWGTLEAWDYHSLGEYPSRGAYDLIQPFYRSLGKDGIEAAPLHMLSLEMMVHVIQEHKKDSPQQRLQAMRDAKAKHDQELGTRIADTLEESVPAFGEAASFSGQQNTKTVLQQKIEQLEKYMPRSAWSRIPRRKGLQQA